MISTGFSKLCKPMFTDTALFFYLCVIGVLIIKLSYKNKLTQRGRESVMPHIHLKGQKEDYLVNLEFKLLDISIYFSV